MRVRCTRAPARTYTSTKFSKPEYTCFYVVICEQSVHKPVGIFGVVLRKHRLTISYTAGIDTCGESRALFAVTLLYLSKIQWLKMIEIDCHTEITS